MLGEVEHRLPAFHQGVGARLGPALEIPCVQHEFDLRPVDVRDHAQQGEAVLRVVGRVPDQGKIKGTRRRRKAEGGDDDGATEYPA